MGKSKSKKRKRSSSSSSEDDHVSKKDLLKYIKRIETRVDIALGVSAGSSSEPAAALSVPRTHSHNTHSDSRTHSNNTDSNGNQDLRGLNSTCPSPQHPRGLPELVNSPIELITRDESSSPIVNLQADEKDLDLQSVVEAAPHGDIQPNTAEALDEDVLQILGEIPNTDLVGEDMHEALVPRVEAILKQGLTVAKKDGLLRKYPPPGNCRALIPPQLNPELQSSSALSVQAKARDNSYVKLQIKIASGLSALGKGVAILLGDPTIPKSIRDNSLTLSAEAAYIFADVFHSISSTRQTVLASDLNKTAKELIVKTTPSTFLFGDALGEKFAQARALEQTGKQLKANTPNTGSTKVKPSWTPSSSYSARPKSNYLNRTGPGRPSRGTKPSTGQSNPRSSTKSRSNQ